ncbi:MAG: hypothetical protein RBU21_00340 [FCB group bacterium]|jgi:hypothetical protein|nr:hypothetical protein [FCB group bacterium]
MAECIVSLDISASLSITHPELSKRFGLTPSALTGRKSNTGKYYRYEPTASEGMALEDRIAFVASGIRPEHPPVLLDESIIDVTLVIGVFQRGLACTTHFPVSCLDSLTRSIPELAVDVTFYMVSG